MGVEAPVLLRERRWSRLVPKGLGGAAQGWAVGRGDPEAATAGVLSWGSGVGAVVSGLGFGAPFSSFLARSGCYARRSLRVSGLVPWKPLSRGRHRNSSGGIFGYTDLQLPHLFHPLWPSCLVQVNVK